MLWRNEEEQLLWPVPGSVEVASSEKGRLEREGRSRARARWLKVRGVSVLEVVLKI